MPNKRWPWLVSRFFAIAFLLGSLAYVLSPPTRAYARPCCESEPCQYSYYQWCAGNCGGDQECIDHCWSLFQNCITTCVECEVVQCDLGGFCHSPQVCCPDGLCHLRCP